MIDIDTVLSWLEGLAEPDWRLFHSDSEVQNIAKKALELLKEQLKTGRWIEKEDYNMDTYYDCSVCGESWTTIDGTPWQNGMNYCPHCGTKMLMEDKHD